MLYLTSNTFPPEMKLIFKIYAKYTLESNLSGWAVVCICRVSETELQDIPEQDRQYEEKKSYQ